MDERDVRPEAGMIQGNLSPVPADVGYPNPQNLVRFAILIRYLVDAEFEDLAENFDGNAVGL